MPRATRYYHPRIALVFDFDGTLAPNAIKQLLEMAGEDPEQFRKQQQEPLLKQGWDSLLVDLYSLLKLSESNKDFTLTRESFKEKAGQIKLYDGVEEMFEKVRGWVNAVVDDARVEFYLLSSGLADLYRHTCIAKEFKALWGSEFHFNEDGKATFIKQIVTHPEKVRYILQLAKGIGASGANSPSDAYEDVPEEKWHVPLDQIIYVGDGLSDMPAFSLMHDRGGIALGVVDAQVMEEWEGYKGMHKGRQVQNLSKADYAEDSELMQSLRLSVKSIAHVMALRKLSKGE